jgi:hypothetical protein
VLLADFGPREHVFSGVSTLREKARAARSLRRRIAAAPVPSHSLSSMRSIHLLLVLLVSALVKRTDMHLC